MVKSGILRRSEELPLAAERSFSPLGGRRLG
jgi:hypothetical protein